MSLTRGALALGAVIACLTTHAPAGAQAITATRIQCASLASGNADHLGTVCSFAQPICGKTVGSTCLAQLGVVACMGYGTDGATSGPASIPTPIPIVGDLNSDGHVNGQDLAIVIGNWGACPIAAAPCPGDVDGNGVVNGLDVAIILGNWG